MTFAVAFSASMITMYLTVIGLLIWPGPQIRRRRRLLGGILNAKKAASQLEDEIMSAIKKERKENG